jgi:hypothetical protein
LAIAYTSAHEGTRLLCWLSVQIFAGAYKCLLPGIAADACEKIRKISKAGCRGLTQKSGDNSGTDG